jgi:hypothetical protein
MFVNSFKFGSFLPFASTTQVLAHPQQSLGKLEFLWFHTAPFPLDILTDCKPFPLILFCWLLSGCPLPVHGESCNNFWCEQKCMSSKRHFAFFS